MDAQSKEALAALLEPAIYPGDVSSVELRETHISRVYLTADRVYKFKKPVDFGFLNFVSLESRAHFCAREVELNRRLAPNVYAGVGALVRNSANELALRLPNTGEISSRAREAEPDGLLRDGDSILDYCVVMRRLPDAENLAALLARGAAPTRLFEGIGERLADFFSATRRLSRDECDAAAMLRSNCLENFDQTRSFIGAIIDPQRHAFLEATCRSFLNTHGALLDARAAEGRICDGHGDLRLDHIYAGRTLEIIDCIEFNERFRRGDCALDLAFLLMDLEFAGRNDAAETTLAACARRMNDPGMYGVIDFYIAYRALVRAKVDCLRLSSLAPDQRPAVIAEIRRYLDLSAAAAVRSGRPALYIASGLPASGKSRIARGLSSALGAIILATDQIRKEQDASESANAPPAAHAFNAGRYSEHRRSLVYSRMFVRADELLRSGHSVILDATFSKRSLREEARRLAQTARTPFVFFHVFCSEENSLARLRKREIRPGLSDARVEHWAGLKQAFEPPEELTPDCRTDICTDAAKDESVMEALAGARDKLLKQQTGADLFD